MSDRRSLIRNKINLKDYLKELSALVGYPVSGTELGDIESGIDIRSRYRKYTGKPKRVSDTLFLALKTPRFAAFVDDLRQANPSPVYIVTAGTMDCGTFLVPSLGAIKWDFDFWINSAGILVFLSSDLEDSLLLDFSISDASEHILKIETQGDHWGRIAY